MTGARPSITAATMCGLLVAALAAIAPPAAAAPPTAGSVVAAGSVIAAARPVTGRPPAGRPSVAPSAGASVGDKLRTDSIVAQLAAATITPAEAVAQAHAEAAANGINDYLSVTDRTTGAVLAQSDSGTQVASESIMKLMLASYYMVIVGGYQNQSQDVLDQLSYMIRYSDDATADAYFTSAAIPTIAARYGMGSTINATDRTGHWGAVRITAHDMTTFLFQAAHDAEVGPWLLPVMAQVAPVGSDGFDQHFGMNSLTGVHGSKQGWGDDQFWTDASNVINSVGYTDRYFVAILQNSYSYPDPARETSTYAAQTISTSGVTVSPPTPPAPRPPPPPPPLRDGDFVSGPGSAAVYRLAGGAPVYVSNWAAFGGAHPVRVLSAGQFAALRSRPIDGTYVMATGTNAVYRMVGGAPIYVSRWAAVGGAKPTVIIDEQAIARAGSPGVWAHLLYRPADGSYLRASGSNQVFRVIAGAPTYVQNWANFGGGKPSTLVDAAAISGAGRPGAWTHLRNQVPDGVFLRATSGEVYRVAGGAPIYVSTWAAFGGPQPAQAIDPAAVALAGSGGPYVHLAGRPRDGTLLSVSGSTAIYETAGGAPLYLASWSVFGGARPTVRIDAAAVSHGGQGGVWTHLLFYPATGSFITGQPGGRVYRISLGRAVYVPSWAPYGGGRPTMQITQLTIARAGTGGYFNHLRK